MPDQTVPACPYCGLTPAFTVNPAVSLTAHIEDEHPGVSFIEMANVVVGLCGPDA